MIKELVSRYGKVKLNTLTKYPSILTLHEMGEKGRLKEKLTTQVGNEQLFATEKIDGTNTRMVCYGDEYLIGSREFILHHSHDLYFDMALGIVDGIRELKVEIPQTDQLTVIYGEFYGGRLTANSKWYGMDKTGFRVFDVAVYADTSLLERSPSEISAWRETETPEGIKYGQHFLTRRQITEMFPALELVPEVAFELGDMSLQTVLQNLKTYLPQTNVALTEKGTRQAEGLVLRNHDRSKIAKVRFEDYERTLK